MVRRIGRIVPSRGTSPPGGSVEFLTGSPGYAGPKSSIIKRDEIRAGANRDLQVILIFARQSGKTLMRMFLKQALLIWFGIGGCP